MPTTKLFSALVISFFLPVSVSLPAGETAPPTKEKTAPEKTPAVAFAEFVASLMRSKQGNCLYFGRGDVSVVKALAARTLMKIHLTLTDKKAAARARGLFADAGLYGTRVVVEPGKPGALNWPTHGASLVVCDALPADEQEAVGVLKEIYRVLNPNGAAVVGGGAAGKAGPGLSEERLKALLKAAGLGKFELRSFGGGMWARLVKSRNPAWGEWPQRNHTAANTSGSETPLDPSTLRLAWANRCPPTLASASIYLGGGRQFIIGPEYPAYPRTTPSIHAYDAYTGVLLWSRVGKKGLPLNRSFKHYSPEKSCSDVVTLGDSLFVLSGEYCAELDAATGKIKRKWTPPEEVLTAAAKVEAEFDGRALQETEKRLAATAKVLKRVRVIYYAAAEAAKKFTAEATQALAEAAWLRAEIEAEAVTARKGNTAGENEEAVEVETTVEVLTGTEEKQKAAAAAKDKARNAGRMFDRGKRRLDAVKKFAAQARKKAATDDPEVLLYLSRADGLLYFALGRSPHSRPGNWGMPWRGWSWVIYAVEPTDGKLRWLYAAPAMASSFCVGGGRLYFYDTEEKYHALDAKTGKELWVSSEPNLSKRAYVVLTTYYRKKLWSFYDLAGNNWVSRGRWFAVFDAETGKRLPDPKLGGPKDKRAPTATCLTFAGGFVYSSHQHSGVPCVALDADTLERHWVKRMGLGGCTPLLATPKALYGRFRGGPGFMDLRTKRTRVFGNFRPTCFIPPLPANGMVYVPGPGCNCPHGFRANVAFLAEKTPAAESVAPVVRLIKGEAFGKSDPPNTDRMPWAGRRGNARRDGRTPDNAPTPLKRAWTASFPSPVTPAAAAGGLVFFAAGDRTVYALDAAAGGRKWRYFAAGRVGISPFYQDGRLYFGDTAGWAYCLRAADGKLVWKFFAPPTVERITVNGELSSRRPLGCGVLAAGKTVYFTAGLFPADGVAVYALDAKTGEVRWKTEAGRASLAAAGALAFDAGILFIPSRWGLPKALKVADEKHRVFSPGGWWGGGSAKGDRLTVVDGAPLVRPARLEYTHHVTTYKLFSAALPVVTEKVIYMRDGKSLTAERREFFKVGRGALSPVGKKRSARRRKGPVDKSPAWLWRSWAGVPMTEVVLAGGTLFSGGRGKVYAARAADGEELWSAETPAAVADLAVNDGRLFVVCVNGAVLCFEPAAAEAGKSGKSKGQKAETKEAALGKPPGKKAAAGNGEAGKDD